MKEFLFNVIMGSWLLFKGNNALQYNIEEEGKKSFPDMNMSQPFYCYMMDNIPIPITLICMY